MTDAATFSSEVGGITLEDLTPENIEARKTMIDMDPPRHDELRAMVNRRFTPHAVTVWEDLVRNVVTEVLDEALPLGEFDFVEHISSEIPMRVFADIMGIPQEERREIIRLGNRLVGRQDPEYRARCSDQGRPAALSCSCCVKHTVASPGGTRFA